METGRFGRGFPFCGPLSRGRATPQKEIGLRQQCRLVIRGRCQVGIDCFRHCIATRDGKHMLKMVLSSSPCCATYLRYSQSSEECGSTSSVIRGLQRLEVANHLPPVGHYRLLGFAVTPSGAICKLREYGGRAHFRRHGCGVLGDLRAIPNIAI